MALTARIRADVVPGQLVSVPNPSVAEWFNTAAFVAPPTGAFGDARRNSIEGPGQRLFDMAFTKIFPLERVALSGIPGAVLEYLQHAAILDD